MKAVGTPTLLVHSDACFMWKPAINHLFLANPRFSRGIHQVLNSSNVQIFVGWIRPRIGSRGNAMVSTRCSNPLGFADSTPSPRPTTWIDGEQTLMVVGTEETLNQRPCCLLLVNRPSRHPIDHDCHSKLLIPLLILLGVYSMPQTSLGDVSLLALRP